MKKIALLAAVAACAISASAQWPSAANEAVAMFSEVQDYPNPMLTGLPSGETWFLFTKIDNVGGDLTETYYYQGLTADGKAIKGNEPALLSKYKNVSWMADGKNIFTDNDGNVIILVYDYRKNASYQGVTAYKVSPSGEQLWGEDGIYLSGDLEAGMVTSVTGCQLTDGSYVFAWRMMTDDLIGAIPMVRLKADGTFAWTEEIILGSAKDPCLFPYIVDGGNSQFILVYMQGSNMDVKAMKYDFDGTAVWSKPTEIYNGGFLTTPWAVVDVQPSGDGGVLFAWVDDRDMNNAFEPYLAYVEPNGELGFNIRNGLCLDYQDGASATGIRVTYDPGSDSFVTVWASIIPTGIYHSVKAQSVSKNGDLNWGVEAKDIAKTDQGDHLFARVVCGEPGRVAFFYQESANGGALGILNYADYYDVASGKQVWPARVAFGSDAQPMTELNAVHSGDFWVAAWTLCLDENGDYNPNTGNVMAQRVNYDGTVGNNGSGISNVASDEDPNAPAEYFSIDGRRISNPDAIANGVVIKRQGTKIEKTIIH